MLNSKPLISVIMAVYNAQDHLHQSIESILNQSFKDFELIIINDGSTDESLKIINQFKKKDNRIKIINQKNFGLTKSLNIGANMAQGEYILRQDADDYSVQDRFQKQIDYLKKNNLVALGSNCINLYNNNAKTIWGHFNDQEIKKIIYLRPPFAHGTSIFRRDFFFKAGMYNEKYYTSQDFDLWIKISKYGKISMLKERLVFRYINKKSISQNKKFRQFYDSFKIRLHHNTGLGKFNALFFSLYHFSISLIPIYIFLIIIKMRNKRLI